jgi:hypothetical protein
MDAPLQTHRKFLKIMTGNNFTYLHPVLEYIFDQITDKNLNFELNDRQKYSVKKHEHYFWITSNYHLRLTVEINIFFKQFNDLLNPDLVCYFFRYILSEINQ